MKKPLVVFSLVVVGAVMLARWMSDGPEEGGDGSEPGLALNRLWLDHLPTNAKDTVNVFVAITEQPIGVFQSASQWKGNFELFTHEAKGDKLRLVFPQNGEKEKLKVRAWKCKHRDMDYCLELTGSSRGVKRYHSRTGWEIDQATRPEQLLDRIGSIVRRATN